MKKRILLCSQWADRYRPLVDGLLDAGRFEIYCEDNFLEQLDGYHPDLKSYQPFIPPWRDSLRLETEARRRITAMARFLAEEARRSLSDFGRYSFLQDARRMAGELRESLGQILYMNEAFDRIASELPLDLLIVDGPGIRQQTWVAAARRHAIPSLEIYHGMIHVKPELVLRRQYQADYMAMGSALVKEVYTHLGLPPERLRVTGLPAKSAPDMTRAEAIQILQKEYGLDPGRRVALLFTSYESGDAFEFLFDLSTGYPVDLIRQAAAAVRAVDSGSPDGLQLVIKRHPTMAASGWDDAEAYQAIARSVGLDPIMVGPRESNALLLAAADAVLVVKFSSTISEAINAGKPVLVWPYSRQWLHDEILQSGAIIPVDDQQSLEAALRRCLSDSDFIRDMEAKRRIYLEKFPHVEVGDVIGNLIEFIDDIISGLGERSDRSIIFESASMPEDLRETLDAPV
jgi:hypothetical protein